jgi:hypothetical protein
LFGEPFIDLGLSYFFAGKFSLLVQQLFADEDFINRSFNALLFLLLFIMSCNNKRLLLFLSPLLCTPQIWYLYAYTNRGGDALFQLVAAIDRIIYPVPGKKD